VLGWLAQLLTEARKARERVPDAACVASIKERGESGYRRTPPSERGEQSIRSPQALQVTMP
jgi:hypothetical protein